MRRRDGRESDLDGGKIACEALGDSWNTHGSTHTDAHCLTVHVSRYPHILRLFAIWHLWYCFVRSIGFAI